MKNISKIVLNKYENESSEENIHNHITSKFSDMEKRMVAAIPEGGNWKDIPLDIESRRVHQIRESGGRTTYYGRLKWDRPSYTISTYFNRMGNGCYIHPKQDRLISLREGARIQSFPDRFIFTASSKTSLYKQIGNAVPPLLARALGQVLNKDRFVDLFCGAGGLSLGIEESGGKCELALDFDKNCINTFSNNFPEINSDQIILGDVRELNLGDLFSTLNKIDLVVGGPPCQGFSTAGKCLLDDPRNELVKYYIKSVELINPKFFLMENVKGLIYFKNGQILKEIISEFNNIGYTCQYKVLMAADYGVPQLRERIIILGTKTKDTIFFPKPLFSENGKELPKYITIREAIDDLPPLEAGGGSIGAAAYISTPKYDYQLLMRNKISFNEFYFNKTRNYKVNNKNNSKEGYVTLDNFNEISESPYPL